MSLPLDIITKIAIDFQKEEDQDFIRMTLEELVVNERIRVIRCILFAANGDIKRFSALEELAKTDYRDVIVAGEYDYPSDDQLRDFNEPFTL